MVCQVRRSLDSFIQQTFTEPPSVWHAGRLGTQPLHVSGREETDETRDN